MLGNNSTPSPRRTTTMPPPTFNHPQAAVDALSTAYSTMASFDQVLHSPMFHDDSAASAAPGVPGGGDMSMESLLNFLSTPPTPAINNALPPPTPTSSILSTSSSLFDQDQFDIDRILTTPDAFLGGYSPDVITQASPYLQTSPQLNLFDDFGLADQPLFSSNFPYSMTAASTVTSPIATSPSTSKATVNPTALGLSTNLSRHNSWEVSTHSSASSSTSPQPPSHRASASSHVPNGIRKNVRLGDLVPVDAPIQARNYITPSATSRREIPPSVARTFVPQSARKRTSRTAGLPTPEEMHDELADEDDAAAQAQHQRRLDAEMDPEKRALLDHVEASRRRNTLAARKSRARKLEHVRQLEELVERLQGENEGLKNRLEQCEVRLRAAGLEVPS